MRTELRYDCTTLDGYCPAWQDCIECSSYSVTVGNHAAWALGSHFDVYTNEVYLGNVTVDYIEIYTPIVEGLSPFDVEYSTEITISVYVNGGLVQTASTSFTGDRTVKFYLGKKVSGYIKLRVHADLRAALGWKKRAVYRPVVQYTENPPPDKARIYIDSNPSGAAVYVDGKYVGTSPCYVDVSEGYHEVSGELSGYNLKSCGFADKTDSKCRVYAAKGETTTVVLEFEKPQPPSVVDTVSMMVNILPMLMLMLMISPMINLISGMLSSIGGKR
jgi:hypothetical protein